MTVTFVVPRGAEAAAVRAANTNANIVAIRAGARAADELPAFARDDVVIVLGLCGALRVRRAGDVVVYRELADDAASAALDAPLVDAVQRALPEAHTVRACTADHVITRAPERAEFSARYDADIVDMESAALTAALRARGVRFAFVRVVSDDATRDLPALDGVIDGNGNLHAGRIALAFLRDPRGAIAFIGDARRALRELTRIARALSSLTE